MMTMTIVSDDDVDGSAPGECAVSRAERQNMLINDPPHTTALLGAHFTAQNCTALGALHCKTHCKLHSTAWCTLRCTAVVALHAQHTPLHYTANCICSALCTATGTAVDSTLHRTQALHCAPHTAVAM